MIVSAGLKLDALLMHEAVHGQKDDIGRIVIQSTPPPGCDDSILPQVDMWKEYGHDFAYEDTASLALSRALNTFNFLDRDETSTKWLAWLLIDALDKDIEIKVALSWSLLFTVSNLFPGREHGSFTFNVSRFCHLWG